MKGSLVLLVQALLLGGSLASCQDPVSSEKEGVHSEQRVFVLSATITETGSLSVEKRVAGTEADDAITFLNELMVEFPEAFSPGTKIDVPVDASQESNVRSGSMETHTVHKWGPTTYGGYFHNHFVNIFYWPSCVVSTYQQTCSYYGETRTAELHQY